MTMIAGFKESGIPILLGDVLLTGQNGWKGLRKKIHKVSPNFVISWTGDLHAAQLVLRELHQHCAGHHVSKDEVESFFKNFPIADLGKLEVRFVGWIVDPIADCFRWNSGWPHELFYDSFLYDGSGADLLEQVNWIRSEIGSSPSGEPDTECAVRRVTDFIVHLLAEEALGNDLQQYGFGHAYEFLYYVDGEFRYMPQTLFTILNLYINSRGKICGRELHNVYHKYQTVVDETIFLTHKVQENTTYAEVIVNTWTKNPLDLEPIQLYFEGLRQEFLKSNGYKFSFHSDYYSFLLRFFRSETSRPLDHFPLIPMSFARGASDEYFKIEEDNRHAIFTISGQFNAFLEEAFKDISMDLQNGIT